MEITTSQKLFAALGNPGEEYRHTYHNAGWLFIDFLKNKLAASSEKSGNFYKAYVCFAPTSLGPNENESFSLGSLARRSKYYKTNGDATLILAEPKGVFMNDSGQYVKSLMNALGLKPEEFVLVHDDSDIPLGEYKLSSGAGSAGHKGVKSVIEALGTKEFTRLRIGIRHNEDKALEFVLSKIGPQEQKILIETFEKIFKNLFIGF